MDTRLPSKTILYQSGIHFEGFKPRTTREELNPVEFGPFRIKQANWNPVTNFTQKKTMLYQTPPSSNSRFTVTFDTIQERFDGTFPVVLQGRLHPQNYSETIERASSIMKEHMKQIESPSHVRTVITFMVVFISCLLLFGIPLTIYIVAYSQHPDKGWWVWVAFPPLYFIFLIGLIIWSVRRRRRIVQCHATCKAVLQNFLSCENQKFVTNGVQFVLRYEPVIIMGSRYTFVNTYKHLAQIPTIEIFVGGMEQSGYISQPAVNGYQSGVPNQYYQPQGYTQQEPVRYEQPTQPLLADQKV